jgi:hypothetical protein
MHQPWNVSTPGSTECYCFVIKPRGHQHTTRSHYERFKQIGYDPFCNNSINTMWSITIPYGFLCYRTLTISTIQLRLIQEGHALMSNILSTMCRNKCNKPGNAGINIAPQVWCILSFVFRFLERKKKEATRGSVVFECVRKKSVECTSSGTSAKHNNSRAFIPFGSGISKIAMRKQNAYQKHDMWFTFLYDLFHFSPWELCSMCA